LVRILSALSDQWHPDAELPKLTKDNLNKSIQDADAAIQDIIDANAKAKEISAAKKGIVHKLGTKAMSVCVHVKPFIKIFLAVAIQGSAVPSQSCLMCSFLDPSSQPFWVIGEWFIRSY